ncbi:hypothetical protein [Paenibacillus gansuensis]|uniref:Copper amine oxidase-like N-terminal domain-containing protein n=1 Tax=Paenibacillus gansuensis TaxID=306542 RepID=A0ABW5PK70_9BACL
MLNLKKISFISALSFSLLVLIFSSASASNLIKSIKASIDYGFTMTVHGKKFAPRDAVGKELRPILYNGTYYVPAKYISESLKIPFSLDTSNKQLIFGLNNHYTDIIKEKMFDSYAPTNEVYPTVDVDALSIGNNVFSSGLIFNVHNLNASYQFTFNIGKQFSKLNFRATVADSNVSFKLFVIDKKSGLILKEATISNEDISAIDAVVVGIEKVAIKIEALSNNKNIDSPIKAVVGNITVK